MHNSNKTWLGGSIGISASVLANPAANADSGETTLGQAQAMFKPLPENMGTATCPVTPDRVRLGRMLSFDPRISLDGTVHRSRSHQPALHGTDAPAKPW